MIQAKLSPFSLEKGIAPLGKNLQSMLFSKQFPSSVWEMLTPCQQFKLPTLKHYHLEVPKIFQFFCRHLCRDTHIIRTVMVQMGRVKVQTSTVQTKVCISRVQEKWKKNVSANSYFTCIFFNSSIFKAQPKNWELDGDLIPNPRSAYLSSKTKGSWSCNLKQSKLFSCEAKSNIQLFE